MANTKLFGNGMIFPITALLILLVLTAGCNSLGVGKKTPISTIPEIYTGIDGIDVGFSPESVPKSISAGSATNVVLLVANKGAVATPATPSTIITVKDTRGAFTLLSAKGTDKFDFSNQLITGKGAFGGKESSPAATGDLEGIVLSIKAKDFLKNEKGEIVENSINTGLLATVCYDYGTKLTANVCVDAAPYSFQKQRKPCDYTVPLVYTKGQGAPVAITRVETLDPDKSESYVKPRFKIFIANVGTGIIINKDKLNLFCAAPDSSKDGSKPATDNTPRINIVHIEKVKLNDKDLKCSYNNKDGVPNEVLSGIASKDYILCNYDGTDYLDGSGTFATPLTVELSYGYTFTSNPIPVTVEKGVS